MVRMISSTFRPRGLRRTRTFRARMSRAALAINARLPPELRRRVGGYARARVPRVYRRTLGPIARRLMSMRRPGRPIPKSGRR